MILALSLTVAMLPAHAMAANNQELLSSSFQLNGETIPYRYREKDGAVVYVEVGNDVIEDINSEIFVNGIKVASYTVTRYNNIENAISPRTSWFWSDSGNRSDYIYDSTYIRDIALERTLAVIGVGTLAAILLLFLPLKPITLAVADKIIAGLTAGFSVYASSKHLYSVEDTYAHKYISLSYAKMIDYTYFYDEDLTDEAPDSAKTLYGSWA